MRTALTERLGLTAPIIQAPMGGATSPALAAAVSNAGGLGMLALARAPETVVRYCIEKGSIAVDGVSLTVAAFDDEGFEVALIPHTLEVTTLGRLESGSEVNLEADVLGKVVARLVAERLP